MPDFFTNQVPLGGNLLFGEARPVLAVDMVDCIEEAEPDRTIVLDGVVGDTSPSPLPSGVAPSTPSATGTGTTSASLEEGVPIFTL